MSESVANNKRIAVNTIALYIRMIVLTIISLYTSRVIMLQLGVDDFGIFSVVGGIIHILAFLNRAMAGGTQRFLNFEMAKKNQDSLNCVFYTSQQIHVFISIIFIVLAEIIGTWYLNNCMQIPEARQWAANWVFQFVISSAVFGVLSVPYTAAIIAHEKMSVFAYFSIVEAILKLATAFALIYAPFDKLIYYASLLFVVSIITFLMYMFYGLKKFEECRHTTFRINKSMIKQMLSFSGWTLFGNLGFVLHTQGIALVINQFFSVAVNAAQGVANQVNGIVNQFVINFLTALNPQVVKTYATGEFEQMHNLIIRGCKIAFCLVSFFVIPIVLEAPTLLKVWLGIVPEHAVSFVRLVLLIILINSFSNLLAAAKGATGKIKAYQMTLTLIGALHVPLAWLAFKLGGVPECAMYVYMVIVTVLQIIRIWFVCRSVNLTLMRFYGAIVLPCILFLGVAAAVPLLLHLYLPCGVASSIIVCIVSVVSVISSTLFIAFSSNERHAIFQMITKKIK